MKLLPGFHGFEIQNPLAQFMVKPIVELQAFGLDFSFTNASLWMLICVMVAGLTFGLGTKRRTLIPNRPQAAIEVLYGLVASMVKENIGPEGRPFFPFIFTIFMMVLLGNLMGMLPYGFTITSQFIVNATLAIFVILTVTVTGFVRHGSGFLRLFMPRGVPWALAPIIVPVELISYLARPITLTLRLTVNMIAGHIAIKVFAAFVLPAGIMLMAVPVLLTSAIIGFEIFIAVVQAYIFTLLTCFYLRDAILLDH